MLQSTPLWYLIQVGNYQSVSIAAEKLHISQPSLSQSIKKLEEDVGVPLFTQKGRNIVLTEYGKYLQEKLTPIINEIDKIPYELKELAKIDNNTIRINVLAVSTLITNAIIEYKRTHSEVHFQLLQNENLKTYDIEISTKLSHSHNFTHLQDKKCFVRTEKIYLAVPNNAKYSTYTRIKLSEIVDEGFICLFGSRQFRLICDKICRHIAFRPNIIFESDNASSVIDMISANLGVGFFPEFSWGNIESKHIKLLEIEDTMFKRDIIVTLNQSKHNNLTLLDFYEFLESYIDKMRYLKR